MSSLDWILNLAILALMTFTVIGTRPLTLLAYLRPLVIVGAVALFFLQGVPTRGNDVPLELAGVALGVVFGVLASLASRVFVRGEQVMAQSGAAYALVWLCAIGLRVAFAQLATHNPAFGRLIGTFSVQHAITGADAWRAAFVLMALAMVVTRVALIALRAYNAKARLALA